MYDLHVAVTLLSFPHHALSPGLVAKVTRRALLVDHDFLIFSEHLSSLPDSQCDTCCLIFSFLCIFCRLLCALFLVVIIILYVRLWFTVYDYPCNIIFCSHNNLSLYILSIVVCSFVLFLLTIVLSVLLGYTDSDWHFGIFKLFLELSPSIYII